MFVAFAIRILVEFRSTKEEAMKRNLLRAYVATLQKWIIVLAAKTLIVVNMLRNFTWAVRFALKGSVMLKKYYRTKLPLFKRSLLRKFTWELREVLERLYCFIGFEYIFL